jgi:predicted DNA-binding protein (UPF0251 family)
MEVFMKEVKPVYMRQANGQIAITNMTEIIQGILNCYQSENFDSMATRISVSTNTLKTWNRTGKARKKIADALISAFPTSPKKDPSSEIDELFDQVFQLLSEIRKRLVVEYRRV